MRLKEKVVLVTASTRGIGLACVKACAEEGAAVYMAGLQMMFSFMMAEDKAPLRMCDSCDTIFVATRKTQRYCCDKCRRKGE